MVSPTREKSSSQELQVLEKKGGIVAILGERSLV
jgi:hypothetical protein